MCCMYTCMCLVCVCVCVCETGTDTDRHRQREQLLFFQSCIVLVFGQLVWVAYHFWWQAELLYFTDAFISSKSIVRLLPTLSTVWTMFQVHPGPWMGTWPWALKSWLVASPGWGHGHKLWNHGLWHVLDGDMVLSSEIMACGMSCFCFNVRKNQKLHGAKHGCVWLRTWAFCSSRQDTVTLVSWGLALLWRFFSGTIVAVSYTHLTLPTNHRV